MSMELRGDGVKALRTYLEEHDHKPQPQGQNHEEKENVMTAREFRVAVETLARLRKTSPETPRVAAFLTRGNGMRVHPVVETTPVSDGKHEERMHKRRQKLLRLEEEARYGRLVKNVQTQNATHELQRHVTSAKHHLSIGANMIAARITAFVAGYMIARALTPNETTRILAGLSGAIVMMVIEMVLFITRDTKIQVITQQQEKQRRGVF